MPAKNKGKGGKHKRKGKKRVEPTVALKFTRKAEGKYEKYGKIVKLMGDCRIGVETPDNCSYVCHIPGKFRKRVWMKMGDIVLFSLRPFDKPVSAEHPPLSNDALPGGAMELDFSKINAEMSIAELSDFYIVLARSKGVPNGGANTKKWKKHDYIYEINLLRSEPKNNSDNKDNDSGSGSDSDEDETTMKTVIEAKDGKGDVIYVYQQNEIRWLTQKLYIPSNFSNIELNANDDGNQDIQWNKPNNIEEEDEEEEDDSQLSDDEKEKRRLAREARKVAPQTNTYEMPSDSDSDVEDEPNKDFDMDKALKDL